MKQTRSQKRRLLVERLAVALAAKGHTADTVIIDEVLEGRPELGALFDAVKPKWYPLLRDVNRQIRVLVAERERLAWLARQDAAKPA